MDSWQFIGKRSAFCPDCSVYPFVVTSTEKNFTALLSLLNSIKYAILAHDTVKINPEIQPFTCNFAMVTERHQPSMVAVLLRMHVSKERKQEAHLRLLGNSSRCADEDLVQPREARSNRAVVFEDSNQDMYNQYDG